MKRNIFILLLLAISFLNCPKKTTHLPINLSSSWQFKVDQGKIGIGHKWFDLANQPDSLKNVKTLTDWEYLTGPNYDGLGWYFLKFNYHGKFNKAALSFESVDDNATIWLNDQKAGDHEGANCAFKKDVSNFIQKGENYLVLLIEDNGGGGGINGNIDLISFENKVDLLKGKYYDATVPVHPEWAKNAVIYELNTRQFSKKGTFKAIEPRIKELKDLGVSIVWFMPIHPIGEKKRKGTLGSYYAVKDFYGINPEFGNIKDFKKLVELIHEAGMYVIIDLVANHTAWDNPLIEKYPEWYTHDSEGKIVAPVADWHDVADLSYDNKELHTYMIKMLKYWVGDVGIDGFRCDVAGMVPTSFWINARKELDAIKPVFMLAEAETPELNAFGFDMTYASTMHHAFNAIAKGEKSPKVLDKLFEHEKYNYPAGSKRMRFTSNHDENSWNESVIARMGKEGAKVGAILTFTLPGTPLIYNGQEAGNKKALSFFEKDPIKWKESKFRVLYQKLGKTYREHPALYQGDMIKLKSDNDDQIYSFIRKYEQDMVVVVTNFSSKPFKGNINFKKVSGTFTEIFSNTTVNFDNKTKFVKLKSWEYLVYCKK